MSKQYQKLMDNPYGDREINSHFAYPVDNPEGITVLQLRNWLEAFPKDGIVWLSPQYSQDSISMVVLSYGFGQKSVILFPEPESPKLDSHIHDWTLWTDPELVSSTSGRNMFIQRRRCVSCNRHESTTYIEPWGLS